MPKNIKLQDSEFNISSQQGPVEFNVDGNTTIEGNLTVKGLSTTVNSTNLEITDNIILVNKDEVGSGVSLGTAGIEVNRGSLSNVSVVYNESVNLWQLTNDGINFYEVLFRGADGINANTLDGYDSAEFAVRAENEIITGNYTFDSGVNSSINITSTNTSLVRYVSDSTGVSLTKYEVGTNADNDFQIQKFIDGSGVFDKSVLTVSMSDSTIILDTPELTQATGNAMLITAGPAGPASAGNDIIISPSAGDTGLDPGSVILGLTSTNPTRVQAENEMHLESPNPIRLLASGSLATSASNGQMELGSIISPNDTDLLITAGASSTGTGADLILNGGASSTGTDGNVIIGDLQVSSTGTGSATLETNGVLSLNSNSGDIVLINSAGPGFLSGEDKQELTISGGDSLDTDPGGDLILKGGTSALGADGSVRVFGDLIVTGSTEFLGQNTTPYPITFFAPSIVMSGLNPGLTLDSKAMVYTVELEAGGHLAYAEEPPTDGTATYDIQRVRSGVTTTIGTVSFPLGATVSNSITITSTSVLVGDIIRINNTATPDSSIGNVTITLKSNIV